METKVYSVKEELQRKFGEHTAKIGIVGLGYVGLPLATCKAKVGYDVVGIDRSQKRVDMVNSAQNYIDDVDDEELKEFVESGKIKATTDFNIISTLDAVIICVPTPLTVNRDPDIQYIVNVTNEVSKYLRKGQLVSLESTTYPGTTQDVMLPILEKSGLKVGEDFFLTFSPERVDPGNERYTTHNINKVLGGITPNCTEVGMSLYKETIAQVIPVSSPAAAEMVKVFENTFRSVNIALVNELLILCDRMGLNVWEVLDAAATKPFGIMSFYPGPGVGGHCIPIDPFYLTWKAREFDFHTRFIELAGEINASMPNFVVYKLSKALNKKKKAINDSKILILGVAYKKNVKDSRESPAEKVIASLMRESANIVYHDPYVESYTVNGTKFESRELTDGLLAEADCVVIITDHSCFDYEKIVEKAQIVMDTRNATKKVENNREKIVLL
jgi:UDP-N-acetyl-D-glucosamine dehydrogenase